MGSKAANTSTTTNQTSDNRIATGAGDIIGLTGATLDASGENASISIYSANGQVAQAAIQAAQALAQDSNKIAGQVADSTSKLVDVSSGQKSAMVITGLAILAAVFLVKK